MRARLHRPARHNEIASTQSSQLNQLLPEYLGALPIDPHPGRPVLYQFNPAGQWIVYSVGSDGKDDGGVFGSYTDTLSKSGYDLDLDINRDW